MKSHLKTLVNVKTVPELQAFFQAHPITHAVVSGLLEDPKWFLSFEDQVLIFKIGVFAQNVIQEGGNAPVGLVDLALASLAVDQMNRSLAFRKGRELAYRIWNNVQPVKRSPGRPRRAEGVDYLDRFFVG